MKNILYIGSGKSALLYDKVNLEAYTVVCANNAWRLFQDSTFDYWVHSGDFPGEHRPKVKNYLNEISYREYSKSADEIVKKLEVFPPSPQHYLGYTIFFMGLYWIMNDLNPDKISLLGFDHDYNQAKVKKWLDNDRPNPQNQYRKPRNQTIEDWSSEFFDGMEKDSFYGHGTPDPIRLGESCLVKKFSQAIENSEKLGIEIVNLSPVESHINIFKKESIT